MPVASMAALLSLRMVIGAGELPRIDLAASSGGRLSMVGEVCRAEIVPASASSQLRIVFAEPLPSAGKERLVLVGRAEEPSGEGLTIAQTTLLDERGQPALTYEPDYRFEHQWNLREFLFDDLGQGVPARLGGLVFAFWSPGSEGQTITFRLQRCALQSRDEVAAELAPPPPPRPQPLAPSAAPGDGRWTSLGPGGGGWYRTIAISPHDGTCFIGADVGGIYRSRDGCRTWEMVNDGLTNRYVNCLAFDPLDPQVIYAGSNGGPLKSTDGGATWQVKRQGLPPLMTFGESAPIASLAIAPSQPQIVLAGVGHERDYGTLPAQTVGGRIFRSTDGGERWTMTELPGGDAVRRLSVLSLLFDPHAPERVFVTTTGGLFRSDDQGLTWRRFGGAFAGYAPTFLALARDDPQRMLLAYHAGPNRRGGILLTTDGGETWRESNTGLPAAEAAWRLLADPVDPRTFYVGWHRQAGLFVTRDGGATWSAANTRGIRSAWFFTGQNVTGLAIDPRDPRRMLYCQRHGHHYQTFDGRRPVGPGLLRPRRTGHRNRAAAVARARGRGDLHGRPQAIAIDPTDPRRFFLGFMDVHGWGTTGRRTELLPPDRRAAQQLRRVGASSSIRRIRG